MNATIRADIAHLVGTVLEMRVDLKELRKDALDARADDMVRVMNVEKAIISIDNWCEYHKGEHESVCERMDVIERDIVGLRSAVRKFGFFGGATGGAGLAGIIELLKGVIK
jgi:hypothetical protein